MRAVRPEAIGAVISRHPQAKPVLYGHLKAADRAAICGDVFSTCRSAGPQIAIDLRPGSRIRVVHEQPGDPLHDREEGPRADLARRLLYGAWFLRGGTWGGRCSTSMPH